MKTRFSLVPLAGTILLCTLTACSHPQGPVAPVVDEAHVQQILLTLPPDGRMRADLELGGRGDGVAYPWMAHMKELGVRRAMLSTEFIWLLRPLNVRVLRIVYFSSYDTNCAQITDRELLGKIAQSGLENELKEFARAKTVQSDWWGIDNIHRALHGSAWVEITDDPWLPVYRTILVPADGHDDLTDIVMDDDLQRLKEVLGQRRHSQHELDGALMDSSAHLDDGCFIQQMIAAGTNPNFKNDSSETPLMYASQSGNAHDVRALLEAGADPGVKNFRGETALDLARRQKYQRIESLLAQRPDGPR